MGKGVIVFKVIITARFHFENFIIIIGARTKQTNIKQDVSLQLITTFLFE